RETRRFVHHRARRSVNLRGLVNAQEVNAATQQRWQLCHLPDVSQLEQEVLVHQQLVRSIRHQLSRTSQGELRDASVVVERGPCSSGQKNRGRFVQLVVKLPGTCEYGIRFGGFRT